MRELLLNGGNVFLSPRVGRYSVYLTTGMGSDGGDGVIPPCFWISLYDIVLNSWRRPVPGYLTSADWWGTEDEWRPIVRQSWAATLLVLRPGENVDQGFLRWVTERFIRPIVETASEMTRLSQAWSQRPFTTNSEVQPEAELAPASASRPSAASAAAMPSNASSSMATTPKDASHTNRWSSQPKRQRSNSQSGSTVAKSRPAPRIFRG